MTGRWRRGFALLGLALTGLPCACGGPRKTVPPPTRLYAAPLTLAGIDTAPLRGRRVLIDPGHGGRFEGAEGADKTREADVNLGVALYLWGLLHDAGASVELTRASDRDLLGSQGGGLRDDLAARVHAIDSLRPDVFLSLHHNSNAALDRERNAIETYYKLDDEGPSYDLGRAIHAQLGRALGIDAASLQPGNYFVLRAATTPAVLGEASYLSNPHVESRLRLAEAQRLEAEAYFLGLRDYFAGGAAAVAKISPAGDTLTVGAALRFAVGEAVDPLSVVVRADGTPLAARLEGSDNVIVVPGDLAPGTHDLTVRARLARGNAARPWSGRLVADAAPAYAVCEQTPTVVRPGGRARVRIVLQDAAGRPLGDGVPVHWRGDALQLVTCDSTTHAGEVLALVCAAPGASIGLTAATLHQKWPLRVEPQAPPVAFARCVDARTQAPVPAAWSGGGAPSDRQGWLLLPPDSSRVVVERRGYVPWYGALPADSTLRLVPVDAGALHGVRFALDPGGDGGDGSVPGSGVTTSDVAYEICARLRDLLAAAGAEPLVVRDAADPVSDLERIRRALVARADWYVRVEVVAASPAAVLYYPGSAAGERLATSVASWLGRRLGTRVPLRTDTRFVLQQTPCPAVLVQLPLETPRTSSGCRRVAYAAFVGVRTALDPDAARRPPLVGRAAAASGGLVTLDGAEVLPLATDGTFRFECVAEGAHLVQWTDAARAVEVQVAGMDTTRVALPPPAP